MLEKEVTRNEQRPQAAESRLERREAAADRAQTIVPAFDVFESPEAYLIRADVPGVRPEQLQVELSDGELSVKARANAMGVGLDLVLGGLSSFEYGIRFRMPAGIDGDKVNAEIANGVLSLHLPKLESRRPRQIQVRAPS